MHSTNKEAVDHAINELKRIKAGAKPSFTMLLAIKPSRAVESFTARMTDSEREVWAKALSLKFAEDGQKLQGGD